MPLSPLIAWKLAVGGVQREFRVGNTGAVRVRDGSGNGRRTRFARGDCARTAAAAIKKAQKRATRDPSRSMRKLRLVVRLGPISK